MLTQPGNNAVFEQFHDLIIQSAVEEAPKELCGYLFRDEEGLHFHRAENIIPYDKDKGFDPNEAFAIALEERALVESLGEIEAIVHSHTNANAFNGKLDFSAVDREACNRGDIPWLLVVLPDQEVRLLHPDAEERHPLLGRPFHYGVFDCYSLIQDAMSEAGIFLGDYDRVLLSEQQKPDWNLYVDNFEREGFIEVDRFSPLQKYDLLLMQIESTKVNHAGIMWESDRNLFYHHLVSRLSRSDVFGGYWDKVTTRVIRHRSMLL